jgi:hypothetical protein
MAQADSNKISKASNDSTTKVSLERIHQQIVKGPFSVVHTAPYSLGVPKHESIC